MTPSNGRRVRKINSIVLAASLTLSGTPPRPMPHVQTPPQVLWLLRSEISFKLATKLVPYPTLWLADPNTATGRKGRAKESNEMSRSACGMASRWKTTVVSHTKNTCSAAQITSLATGRDFSQPPSAYQCSRQKSTSFSEQTKLNPRATTHLRIAGLFFRRNLSSQALKNKFALPGYITHRQHVWDREAQRQVDAETSLPSMHFTVQFGGESRVVTDMANASPAAIAAGECR